MEKKAYEGQLIALPNDKLPLGTALVLGLQHLLAMDIYVVPFVIASVLALPLADSAFLIQATFIGAGLATIVQSRFCMQLPIAQGPSYAPIGAVLGIAFASGGGVQGLSSVFGAIMVGSIIILVLGLTGVVRKIINFLVTPLVGGTIIVVVGLSLLPVAIFHNVYPVHGDGNLTQNIIMGLTSMFTLTACVVLGINLGKRGKWLRVGSVIIAMVAGTAVAGFMGRLDLAPVAAAPWFSLPRIAFLEFPVTFDISAIITFLLIYAVLMAETTGTWYAVSSVIEEDLTPEQINRGVIGEGIGCFLGSIFGGTPVTGYSTNAGLISITGIASRQAFYACSLWMVLFGLSGKLSTLIAIIPAPVVGGVFAVICAIISLAGFRIIRHIELTERNMFVIGIPIIISQALFLLPPDYLKTLPQYAQYVLSSPLACAAVCAIVLNKMLPEHKEKH